jgi:hypothetical protein
MVIIKRRIKMSVKKNHNFLAVVSPSIVVVLLAILVYNIPEISMAPLETTGRTLLKLALFMAAWPISLRYLGGTDHSVTENAKAQPHGLTPIGVAIILGTALVIM